ncbi:kinase-like protein, partial [Macrolepiota fuliginosa MF-IS2]
VLLYKLSTDSQLYPRCYTLKDITSGNDVKNGGGFCDIYKGQYGEQSLCLKVVRVFDDQSRENTLKSLGKEATLWGSFNHPNIIPFYGIFYLEFRQSICLVSPWMDHGNLVEYLKHNPSAPRMNLIHDIISGLEYLHDHKDVIHGDLKGKNVLVNASGRACLTDFGLSTIRTDNTLPFTHTTNYNQSLTTRWTAPEMLDGSRRSKEGDIWAFGSVCYEILTRNIPYHEYTNDAAVIRRITTEQLPTRPEANPNSDIDQVSDKTWALMERCWSAKASNRPRCSDIKQELELDENVEPWDAETHMEHATQQREQFQNILVERKYVPIDLAKVERIFRAMQYVSGDALVSDD